jgi:hypothetical protein
VNARRPSTDRGGPRARPARQQKADAVARSQPYRTKVVVNNDGPATVRRRLVQALRGALVPILSEGNWEQIESDHRKVGLPWRADLKPGWGKPKYVGRVLDELPDEEVVEVARRVLERLADRFLCWLLRLSGAHAATP